MILRALYDYYKTLENDPESGVSQIGYSKEKVSYVILLNKRGDLKELIDARSGGKPLLMDVPQHFKRASNVLPYFLCDNSKYILGTEKDKFEACKSLHCNILKNIDDESAIAVLKFFEKWEPKMFKNNEKIKEHREGLEKGGNLVFTVEGIKGYVHEKLKIKEAWKNYLDNTTNESDSIKGQCLVTGKITELLRVHDSIKGVRKAQSSGAAIVSFNKESFESYGKKQSINAPVGKEAAFAYVTALNYILNPSSIQNIQIGDTTTVFWAEKSGGEYEELIYALFNPTDVEEKIENDEKDIKKGKIKEKKDKEKKKTKLNDAATILRMRDFLKRVAKGEGLKDLKGYDPNVKFYILGLSPNNSRISVRFFYADSFGKIVECIKQHYDDMSIEKQSKNERDTIAIWELLRETAAQGKSENIQPAFSGNLMRSILTGGAYPQSVFQALITRIRVDATKENKELGKDFINYKRAAFIKAYLQRKNRINKKEGGVTMSLNPEEKNIGYCLGRIFALLEKAQKDASPGTEINTTIKDKYFGTASSSPRMVFPILLRLVQHHISAAEYGKYTDKMIEEVMNMIGGPTYIPAHLNLDDQGMFMLGYYHQRNDLYKKKN